MKAFVIPEIEIVRFEQKDVITTSQVCGCVECPQCPEKDSCSYDY